VDSFVRWGAAQNKERKEDRFEEKQENAKEEKKNNTTCPNSQPKAIKRRNYKIDTRSKAAFRLLDSECIK